MGRYRIEDEWLVFMLSARQSSVNGKLPNVTWAHRASVNEIKVLLLHRAYTVPEWISEGMRRLSFGRCSTGHILAYRQGLRQGWHHLPRLQVEDLRQLQGPTARVHFFAQAKFDVKREPPIGGAAELDLSSLARCYARNRTFAHHACRISISSLLVCRASPFDHSRAGLTDVELPVRRTEKGLKHPRIWLFIGQPCSHASAFGALSVFSIANVLTRGPSCARQSRAK